MPLLQFDTLDVIPEAQRASALALADGRFAVYEPEDTSSLANDLKEWKRKAEMAERATRKALEEAERAKLDDKANKSGITAEKLAEIRAEVRREVENEVQPQLEAAKQALNENRSLKLDTKVKALALSKDGGVRAERIEAWWKLHSDKFDLTTDGEPVVRGKEGVSLKAFIADDLKKEVPDFYVGSQAEGGGAAGTQNRAPNGKVGIDPIANPTEARSAARLSGTKE